MIEGLLFAAGEEGLNERQLSQYTGLSAQQVRDRCEELRKRLDEAGRGIQLRRLNDLYQLTTRPEHAPFLEQLNESPRLPPLSQAALETLAIIAYRQPVTRIDIEEIRGVKSERALATLLARGLIRETGRADAPGRPILYGTTPYFLEYFGLQELGDLPFPELATTQEEGFPLFAEDEESPDGPDETGT
ncbi:SMC-Scp complex subunit ScpB [Kyrpidia tusciae]|uniref:Segregation and condensation protein B n=1 Tax=Kyrpidia tusciae (strain DSM 2912 / NBRC 15312 / T2) TaxID=562970 RepID=D5WQB1_KYRT2|nr:SMC-Scp complex subunit ScpB [Kyrpidia tusciae]ADG06520.1 chromosome segregation and condensation protein, ScpB [Kyrpidia tusciae DSM 2912]